MTARPNVWLVILTAAAVLIAVRAALPLGVFWISDAGNKFLETQNFVLGHFRHVAIGYPAADLDPQFRWFPTGGEHFRPVGSQFFSIVPFQFPLLNAPLYGAMGPVGVTIIPLLGGVGILMLVPLLLRELHSNVSESVAVVVTAFATPLAFYSVDFWEHTVAAFFATLAVVILLKEDGHPFFAGIVIGASILFREEGYVVLFAVVVALANLRKIVSILAGAAVAVAPLWLVQQRIYGHFLGLHLVAHATGDSLPSLLTRIGRNYFYFLLQFHERPAIAVLLAVAIVAAIVSGSFRRIDARVRLVVLLGVFVASAAGVIEIMTARDPVVNTISTQGLLLFLPFTACFVTRWREFASRDDAAGLLSRIAIVYIVTMPLVLRANWSGIIWGPRYFLDIVPIAVVLSLEAALEIRRHAATTAVIGGLLAVSIALEAYGLVLLDRKLTATAALVDRLREGPAVMITDVFWLPEETSSLFFEKKMMMPPNDRELIRAVESLQQRGVTEFLFVTATRYHWYSPQALRLMDTLAVARVPFTSRSVPLLDVTLLDCRLPPRRR